MKTFVTLLWVSVVTLTAGRAQDCLGVRFKTGMNYELSTFNAKDKPTGKIAYQVKDVRREGNSTVMDITAQFQDDKGKPQVPYTIHYTCTGDELVADMSGLMQSMQNGLRDAEMRLKTNKLVYPGKLSVGQKLADGQLEAEMLSKGSTLLTMNMTMSNRQVAGKDAITTPAGTFDTYKVTSDMSFENRMMGIPIRGTMRTVSYRAANQLFDVKSETYNKNGKLMGYSLLSKVN